MLLKSHFMEKALKSISVGFLTFMLLSQSAWAIKDNQGISLLFDKNMSALTGASNTFAIARTELLLEDLIFPNTEGKTPQFGWGVARIGALFARGAFDTVLVVSNHEISGHGGRAREFCFAVDKYAVWPFQNDVDAFEGYTQYTIGASFQMRQPSNLHKRIALIMGGSEASTVLARHIQEDMLIRNRLDPRESLLYTIAFDDIVNYISLTQETRNLGLVPTGDIDNYVRKLQQWHMSNSAISVSRLSNLNIINLFNPMLWTSLWYNALYIYDGTLDNPYPSFQIGPIKFFPELGLIFAPYGPEVMINNYMRYKTTPFIVGLRFGSTGQFGSFAISLKMPGLYKFNDYVSIGPEVHFWRQPSFKALAALAKEQTGVAIYANTTFRANKQFALNLSLGYKSEGYVQGEQIGNGFLVRGGITAYLG